jgi:hypothetical protein
MNKHKRKDNYMITRMFRICIALFIGLGLYGCVDKISYQATAEENSVEYMLEKRKDILVLDSAEFGPLDQVAESDTGGKIQYRLPYFTQVINSQKKAEPCLVEFLLDSSFQVVRLALIKPEVKKTQEND